MKLRAQSKAQPEIPTASMADVAFLLIIFFLLATNFISEKGLVMDLPNAKKAEDATTTKKENPKIRISKRKFYLNEKEISREDLLHELKKITATAEQDGDRIVVVRADKNAAYERFVIVKELMEESGEPFTDANENGKWDPGERYEDENKNGRYDPGVIATIEIEEKRGANVLDKEDIQRVSGVGKVTLKGQEDDEE